MSGIVDAHHHVWRQADLPWLSGPMVPRIFGPYEPLRRDYSIGEYLADAEANGVTRSVYVQANWPATRALDEIEWVQSVADASGWPHGIVGYVDLLAEDCAPALDAAMQASPLLRGMRMQLHWHENTLYRFAPRPDLCDDPKLRKNLARLAERGLLFELQVFAPQMESAARLARSLPNCSSCSCTPGCSRTRAPRGSPNGGQAWTRWPRARTSRSSSRAWAHFCAGSMLNTWRWSREKPCAASVQNVVCSARTSRLKSCGPITVRCSAPIGSRSQDSPTPSARRFFGDRAADLPARLTDYE